MSVSGSRPGRRSSPRRQPLREHAFRFSGIGLGLLIGAVLVLLPAGISGRLPLWVLAVIVGSASVIAVGAATVGLIVGRALVGDAIEAAVREPGGPWRHGRISTTPGHLTFQPYIWQVRVPQGPAEEIEVDELSPDVGRRPRLRQIWSLNPQVHIVQVRSGNRHLELAALPSRLLLLRQRLQPIEPRSSVQPEP